MSPHIRSSDGALRCSTGSRPPGIARHQPRRTVRYVKVDGNGLGLMPRHSIVTGQVEFSKNTEKYMIMQRP